MFQTGQRYALFSDLNPYVNKMLSKLETIVY
jgi:hypothetical protein